MSITDRQVTKHEIAEAVGISTELNILLNYLRMRKISVRWVPHRQKSQVSSHFEGGLVIFKRNKKNFSRHFVAVDKTWKHHNTPESRSSRNSGQLLTNQKRRKARC